VHKMDVQGVEATNCDSGSEVRKLIEFPLCGTPIVLGDPEFGQSFDFGPM
jgi:hypothetical protein